MNNWKEQFDLKYIYNTKSHIAPTMSSLGVYHDEVKAFISSLLAEKAAEISGICIDFAKKSKQERLAMDAGDIGYMHGYNDALEEAAKILEE